MEYCDVLIVGAGPTGLMMAIEFARYGVNCRIVDRSLTQTEHSKALAIQPRTMEIFHFLGIDPKFCEIGHKIHRLNIFSNHGPIGHIELDSLASPFPFILSLPQSNTEEILNHHLQNLEIQVERGLELVELEEKDTTAIATLQRQDQQKAQIEAKYVIGCDGAHSFVRKHLNLTFKGRAFPDVFSLADVQMDWKYPSEEVCVFWNPEGVLAAIPLPQKGHYRLIFQLKRCQNHDQKGDLDNLQVDIAPPSLKEVQEIVRNYADPKATVSQPLWLANFHVNSRLADRYQLGKFFLAGDAAHIHSPIGGQGMNTGLQDAFNLAWKMAYVLQGKASDRLLDSYHEERHAIARALLKGTEIGTHLVSLKKGWEISLRDGIVSFLLQFAPLRKKMTSAVSQIHIQYPVSGFVREEGGFKKGPKAGSRIPDCELGNGVKLFDLLVNIQSFFVIFLLGSKKVEKLTDQLEKLKTPIQTIFIVKSPVSIKTGTVFVDTTGEIHQLFGAQKDACYVVRPDTYIGYRQTPIHPKSLQAYFEEYSHS